MVLVAVSKLGCTNLIIVAEKSMTVLSRRVVDAETCKLSGSKSLRQHTSLSLLSRETPIYQFSHVACQQS